ncbi:MAG TPA: glycosyltransferase family 9 protein, partial [Flavobacteriaceae bacterium]|nr:glycosyltransferase family 9 protein [Flavobacteriaceae bacterium]
NLFVELSKLHITEVADLHNVLRSKILRFFFSLVFLKTKHIDKGRAEKKALTKPEGKVFKPLKTTVERYADVFRKLGYTLDLSNPEFPNPKILTEDIVTISGKKNNYWIGIAPYAQYTTKMYPLHQMEEVIKALNTQNNCTIFLFGGGKKEVEILSNFDKKYNNVINVAGKLNLEKELDLISNLDVMLSMDSGNAHFAAMQGIPVVTIWGATHPYAGFAPFNQSEKYALLPDLEKYPKLPTSIYGNKKVEGYENVMESITPKIVVAKIKEVLAIKKAR